MTEDTSGGPDTKIIYKDSGSGEIVTKEYALANPLTTEAHEVPEDATPEDNEGEDTGEHDTLGEADE